MKTIKVGIRGTSSLLIHRFSDEAANGNKGSRRVIIENPDPREEATKVAYIDKDGHYFFSAFSIPACMAAAGSNHKLKGSRKSLRFIVPSAVRMLDEGIVITNGDGEPVKNFEVDSRPVTIPATKGRIMRHRPRFDNWSATFLMVLDDSTLTPELAQQLLVEAGQMIGIGDFRPSCKGPFGCFRVVLFEEYKD